MKEKLNRIKELTIELNKATEAYDEGHPYISDAEWDDMYFELARLEKECDFYFRNSPTQKINYEIVNELKKVKHNHPMLSLNKTKDWNEFLNYFINKDSSKDIIGTIKLDGLTCSLRYIDGYLVSAETRGDGEIGEDILHNAKVLKSIPKRIDYKDELILDGEIICTYQDFEQWKDEYKNPRNFAAGSIRLLDSKECENRNLTFVVWNIVKGFDNDNSFMQRLQEAEELGFTITPWTSSFNWDAKEFLQEQAKRLGYPIDGLVGRFDDIEFGESLGSTAHHSNAAYAFKFYDEEYETKLLDIDYDVSRLGILTPVAIFKPIEIDGTNVSRASLHNLSVMGDLLHIPFYLQKIKVVKSNQIIPQIISAEKYEEVNGYYGMGDYLWYKDERAGQAAKLICLPEKCPICGGDVIIKTSETGTKNIYCDNSLCQGKLSQQLDHYCDRKKGLDIRGLSHATLGKLIDLGWLNNIIDIYSLKGHRLEWIKLAGFGEKSVDKILNAIEESKKCKLENFISALGIPLIGLTVAKEIVKYYPTWNDFKDAIGGKWSDLDGFGLEMEKSLNSFDYTEADKIAEMLNFIESEKILIVDLNNSKDFTLCVTGKLGQVWKKRDDLIAFAESKGCKVTGSISAKTNYLVCNDKDSNTVKHQNAKKLGIPIINETELKELLI
jgi:DNA ligase (NAD+)